MSKQPYNPYCIYYKPHFETILRYCECLYKISGCGAGGLLHILLDDDNIDDDSIIYCLKECMIHPEKEESKIGILICEEYLKLSIEERYLLNNLWTGRKPECINPNRCTCKHCEMITDPDDCW